VLQGITTAVTGPPPKDYDFKTGEIGGSGSPLGYALLGLTTSWQSKHELTPQLIVELGLSSVGTEISRGRKPIHRIIAKTDHNKAQAWNDVDPLPSLSICADHVFGSVRD
jgi:hypothetical protein